MDQLFELRRRELQSVQITLAKVHQLAELGEVSVPHGVHTCAGQRGDLIEDPVVTRLVRFPCPFDHGDRVCGEALLSGHADDQGQRLGHAYLLETRTVLAPLEDQRLAVGGDGVVDSRRRAVGARLALVGELVDAPVAQLQPEGVVQRPQDGYRVGG